MKFHHYLLLPLAWIGLISPSNAAYVSQTVSISQSGVGASTDFDSIQAFDATLGTLNQVQLHYSGNFKVFGTYATQIVGWPTPAPVPYAVNIKVQNYLTGQYGLGGFSLNTPAIFTFFTVASGGYNETYSRSQPFAYDLTFDSTSDLLGLAQSTNVTGLSEPTPTAIGELSNFTHANLALQSFLLVTTDSIPENHPAGTLNGTITITYDYTPTPSGSTVPEPGSAALVGLCLAGLALFRKQATVIARRNSDSFHVPQQGPFSNGSASSRQAR